MSQSIFCLNPPKTFNKRTSLLPSSAFPSSSSSSSSSSLSTRMTTKYPMCPLEIVSCQQQPSLEILTRGGYRGEVLNSIRRALPNCLSETHLHETVPGLKSKTRGKVRDIYDAGDYLVLVATYRQSAFDRVLASIPFKGEVLNETSLWWFDRTQHMTPNAVVSAPDKNVTIAKKCSVFLVEFVGGS